MAPILNILEKAKEKKYGQSTPNHFPIFIIGSPRSGTTIFYQILSSTLDCIYFDNLTHLAKETPIIGKQISQFIYGNRRHQSFQSQYGDTSADGLLAPSEGGQILHYLLNSSADTFMPEYFSQESLIKLKSKLFALLNIYKKPFISKNTYNSLRMELLSKVHPSTKIIWIKRDPFFTAQSIYFARKKNNTAVNKWWGVKTPSFHSDIHLPFATQIIKQVFEIERHIFNKKNLFRKEQWLEINYSELENPLNVVMKCEEFLGYRLSYSSSMLKDITVQNTHRLTPELKDLFLHEIQKYNWDNYTKAN
ncbi:MAG: sulfotransferase [Bacteroidales bacterium]